MREEPVRLRGGLFEVGRWDPPASIWIVRARLTDRGVLKHEMLHYLIGHGGHPVPPFILCTEGR